MRVLLYFMLIVLCYGAAELPNNGECVIELECEECLPEHPPRVVGAAPGEGGVVRVPAGAELTFECARGHFLEVAAPQLRAACHAGRWRAAGAGAVYSLLQLGCQEDVIEDVQHSVAGCAPPLHGRAYVTAESGRTRHLALGCWDAERAAPRWLAAGPALPPPAPHSDARAPLSLLGNFNQMFDASSRRAAERLLGDEARLGRRLRALLGDAGFEPGDERPAAARLLAPAYFPAQDARAAEFASNAVPSWRAVVRGNLRLLQLDVAAFLRSAPAPALVAAGTHGTLALGGRELRLLGARVPVPRYLWTAVLAPRSGEGVALVLLNDPLVAVSEIRAAVFCESACGGVPWLARLRAHRAYERAARGLLFCCALPEFAARVPEMPRAFFNESVRMFT